MQSTLIASIDPETQELEPVAQITLTTALAIAPNPHSVTKAQVGLGSVDNTSDANKPVSTATQTALDAVKSTADAANNKITMDNGNFSLLVYATDSNNDILSRVLELGRGMFTLYAQMGTTNNPAGRSVRGIYHQGGATQYAWLQIFDDYGNIFMNYVNGGVWYGWKRFYSDADTASTAKAGIVQLTDGVTSTSITTAATPAAVKSAYDLASEAKAGLPTFIYKCTGTADSTAIANIVNDFFNNGTAMNMKLIITGTMGVAFTNTYYAMYIGAANTRGAVCYLDFSDCYIPAITTASRDFLCVSSSAARLDVSGLVVTTTRYGVNLYGATSTNFSNCMITSNAYGVYLLSTFAGSAAFTACKINGASYGVYAQTANTGVVVTLNGCSISSSTNDVYQSTASSTMSWHIVGCIFAGSSIRVNGVAMSADGAAANAYLYMPAYANKFSRTIS